jgi:hypothetical protein
MEMESQVEFHQRWVKTAEADLQSARHKWLVWMVAVVAISVAYVTSQFMPWLGAKIVHLLLIIPFLVSLIKAVTSASDLGDAKKFLWECRRGVAGEIQSNP